MISERGKHASLTSMMMLMEVSLVVDAPDNEVNDDNNCSPGNEVNNDNNCLPGNEVNDDNDCSSISNMQYLSFADNNFRS